MASLIVDILDCGYPKYSNLLWKTNAFWKSKHAKQKKFSWQNYTKLEYLTFQKQSMLCAFIAHCLSHT